jgi:hypothetical protein
VERGDGQERRLGRKTIESRISGRRALQLLLLTGQGLVWSLEGRLLKGERWRMGSDELRGEGGLEKRLGKRKGRKERLRMGEGRGRSGSSDDWGYGGDEMSLMRAESESWR